jgi:glycosyltransferase involved in cell wall biosynthesis
MKVAFIMPGHGKIPVGGFRIIFIYANMLANHGYDVCLFFSARVKSDKRLIKRLYRLCGYITFALTESWSPKKWFNLHPLVRQKWVTEIEYRFIANFDLYISTTCDVAERVSEFPGVFEKHLKLIQGLETFLHKEDYVKKCWSIPSRRIVIASWLNRIAQNWDLDSAVIYNGVDASEFYISEPFSLRKPKSILFMYHPSNWKGGKFILEVTKVLLDKVPELKLVCFSAYERPADLDNRIEFVKSPNRVELRGLYNRCRFFFSASTYEGWALPPSEAMLCGTVCILSDIPGHREYSQVPSYYSYYFNPNSQIECIETILHAISNEKQSSFFSNAAAEEISKFSWSSAFEKFKCEINRFEKI